jgi:hypothetical protein
VAVRRDNACVNAHKIGMYRSSGLYAGISDITTQLQLAEARGGREKMKKTSIYLGNATVLAGNQRIKMVGAVRFELTTF